MQPLGLEGVLRMNALVRGVTSFSKSAIEGRKPWLSGQSRNTGTPPAMRTISG